MKISLRKMIPFLAIFCLAMPLWAQSSNRGTAEVTINGKKISINYGRPSLKGRDLLTWAKVGDVWRLGMNQATEITSTGDLVVGGKELKAGKYSLWAKKTGLDSWELAFHPKTGMWGMPAMKEGFVAETPLKSEKVSAEVEQLVISLAEVNNQAQITIQWGKVELVGSFEVK
jgi:predicted DNA-binding WGR domain protein